MLTLMLSVPLENNPEVFNDLIQRIGVDSKLGFYDVYSIDEPALLSMIPRPVHALIFISPAPNYYKVREKYDGLSEKHLKQDAFGESDGKITYNKFGDDEPVVWWRQTIGHACGLYALLHAVGNGPAKQFIIKDSLMDNLLKASIPLKRAERADVLYNSKALEEAHMASARMGDSITPSAEEPVGYHFITFTRGKDGHLWELEGSWDPIDRGVVDESKDFLEVALELGIRRFVEMSEGNLEFSIVALATRPEDN